LDFSNRLGNNDVHRHLAKYLYEAMATHNMCH
jgi:hypothetical protein